MWRWRCGSRGGGAAGIYDGGRPTPREAHTPEALWADHSSGNVFADIPCYGYGDVLDNGPNAVLSVAATGAAATATAGATTPQPAVVEMIVHFRMRPLEPTPRLRLGNT